MPQVPADVLAEVFSADNPLSDVINFNGKEIRCYVETRFFEDDVRQDSTETVASLPQPIPAGLEDRAEVTYDGNVWLVNSVRDQRTDGLVEVVLVRKSL